MEYMQHNAPVVVPAWRKAIIAHIAAAATKEPC